VGTHAGGAGAHVSAALLSGTAGGPRTVAQGRARRNRTSGGRRIVRAEFPARPGAHHAGAAPRTGCALRSDCLGRTAARANGGRARADPRAGAAASAPPLTD